MDFARPHSGELEFVMTWQALAEIDTEFQLLFDAHLPEGRESEIRGLLAEEVEGESDSIPMIQYAQGFRRVFTNGTIAHSSNDGVKLSFWNRKVRLESGDDPVIISSINAEAKLGWAVAIRLWRQIHGWGQFHWKHWSNFDPLLQKLRPWQ